MRTETYDDESQAFRDEFGKRVGELDEAVERERLKKLYGTAPGVNVPVGAAPGGVAPVGSLSESLRNRSGTEMPGEGQRLVVGGTENGRGWYWGNAPAAVPAAPVSAPVAAGATDAQLRALLPPAAPAAVPPAPVDGVQLTGNPAAGGGGAAVPPAPAAGGAAGSNLGPVGAPPLPPTAKELYKQGHLTLSEYSDIVTGSSSVRKRAAEGKMAGIVAEWRGGHERQAAERLAQVDAQGKAAAAGRIGQVADLGDGMRGVMTSGGQMQVIPPKPADKPTLTDPQVIQKGGVQLAQVGPDRWDVVPPAEPAKVPPAPQLETLPDPAGGPGRQVVTYGNTIQMVPPAPSVQPGTALPSGQIFLGKTDPQTGQPIYENPPKPAEQSPLANVNIESAKRLIEQRATAQAELDQVEKRYQGGQVVDPSWKPFTPTYDEARKPLEDRIAAIDATLGTFGINPNARPAAAATAGTAPVTGGGKTAQGGKQVLPVGTIINENGQRKQLQADGTWKVV